MSDRKWFTPAEGLAVIDPHTHRAVPATGQWVRASDEFFLRRAQDGDGKLTDAPPADAPEGDV